MVLKGADTVVTDGQRYYINTTGNPGMATGGTGDVLTGVIAALSAQKLPPFEAAQLGVFIHGLAGDIARDQNGEIGMIAGDLVDALPDAFVHAMPDPDRTASMDDDSIVCRSPTRIRDRFAWWATRFAESGDHWSMPANQSWRRIGLFAE